MISKQKTLKTIKEKVDSRVSGKIKLQKKVSASVIEGTFRHNVNFRVCALVKRGNSVMCIDDIFQMRNINLLDTKVLHQIMWQLISDKEKKEIALEHLLTSKTYLED